MPEPKPEFHFRPGDTVNVTGGPYRGARGQVSHHCDASPKNWHVDWLGRDPVCLPGKHLELVFRNNSKPEPAKQDAAGPVRLVGITGRKRAGKDTVAARLIEKHGFKRMAFADNVRRVALAIDPFVAPAEIGGKFIANLRLSSIVESVGWETAKDFPEVRRLLQKIGTEGIRSLEPDFWIRQVMRQAEISSEPVAITDVRFPNEADAIKGAGGVILRVRRGNLSEEDAHSSETAMDDYLHDWALNNNGTIEELYRKVDELVASGFQARR